MSRHTAIALGAIAWVLHHEGGLVDHPADPGGITNYGVSLRWLAKEGLLDLDGDGIPDGDINGDGVIDAADIRSLDQAEATRLYKLYWWDRPDYDRMLDVGAQPGVVAKLLDLSVNMGPTQAAKCLQRAMRACGRADIIDDGKIGPRTQAALGTFQAPPLLAAFASEAAGFYRLLAAKDARREVFLAGWLTRAYAAPPLLA